MSRLGSRLLTLAAVLRPLLQHNNRIEPVNPERILLIHQLLIGDTLMLTPLIAKLRQQYPTAKIFMAGSKTLAPLYSSKPYNLNYIPFSLKDTGSCKTLLSLEPFDLAFIPGDNRYSILAYAMGTRWIKGFAGDSPKYKNWLIDKLYNYPTNLMHLADINMLLQEGEPPAPFLTEQWQIESATKPNLPDKPYLVFHIGASNVSKLWQANYWRTLADHYTEKGFSIIWSAASTEQTLIDAVGIKTDEINLAGQMDLAQLAYVLQHAKALVCPDTGIAHVGRITDTPTLVLFGAGNPDIFGNCSFWNQSNYIAIQKSTEARHRIHLFNRELPWLKVTKDDSQLLDGAQYMDMITPADVIPMLELLLSN